MKSHHDPESFVQCYEVIKEQLDKDQYNFIDQLSQICQTLIWGDKNNDNFFDYFCDQNTLQIYQQLAQTDQRDVVISVIKSITMLLQNISKPTSINYILSHPALQKIITQDYNFQDDEILAYYINFLKGVSIRIDKDNIQLFFNLKFSQFPMLMRAIQFYNNKENLIRTSVRNIVLGISQIKHQQLRRYLMNFPFVLFYIQFSCYMRDGLQNIIDMINEQKNQIKIVKLLLDDQLDIIYFLEDFMKSNPDLIQILTNATLTYGFIPAILKFQQTSIKFLLYIMIQIYKSFTQRDFLDILSLILLGRNSNIKQFVENQSNLLYIIRLSQQTCYLFLKLQYELLMGAIKIIYLDLFIIRIQEWSHRWLGYLCIYIIILGRGLITTNLDQNQVLDLNYFIQFINDKGMIEELKNISNVLQLDMVEIDFDEQKCPSTLLKHFRNNNLGDVQPLKQPENPQIFHTIFQCLKDQDDTVMFLFLLFIKTIRHQKYISHEVLAHIGLITPDKNLELYQSPQCTEMREYIMDQLLFNLEVGSPPYRLGSFILMAQLFIDLSRQDLEKIYINENFKQRLYAIIKTQVDKIYNYMNNLVDLGYIIDFFQNENKTVNKNTIGIWPFTHLNLLFDRTEPGKCQIDPKHNDSVYFIEPTNQQDKIRRDLLNLMILKYLGILYLDYSEEQKVIIENPNILKPETSQWQPGQEYDILQLKVWKYKCILTWDKKYENCILIDDKTHLVIAEQIKENLYKVLISVSIKITDEKIERLKLSQLHVSYNVKQQTILFDLDFPNKVVCEDVKKMIDKYKMEQKTQEEQIIRKYLKSIIY